MTNEVEIFLNLTLSLINPVLFQMGLEMLQKLHDIDLTKGIAHKWQSVYSGRAIISNRIMPPHRDSKGKPEWFDSLLNYSRTDTSPRPVIEDVSLDLQYSSSTVVGVWGTVFKHGVGKWRRGDRICYTQFVREAVRERLGVNPAGWVYRSQFLPGQDIDMG